MILIKILLCYGIGKECGTKCEVTLFNDITILWKGCTYQLRKDMIIDIIEFQHEA
jgi:hypothetical protein